MREWSIIVINDNPIPPCPSIPCVQHQYVGQLSTPLPSENFEVLRWHCRGHDIPSSNGVAPISCSGSKASLGKLELRQRDLEESFMKLSFYRWWATSQWSSIKKSWLDLWYLIWLSFLGKRMQAFAVARKEYCNHLCTVIHQSVFKPHEQVDSFLFKTCTYGIALQSSDFKKWKSSIQKLDTPKGMGLMQTAFYLKDSGPSGLQ